MSIDFYRAFEEKHRGSRQLIKQRLGVYLPFLMPLLDTVSTTKILDLGCGRGEWLELTIENGFAAEGVDLNEGMLAACWERNFAVHRADAISFISQVPDASLAAISAFHFVEHISFDDLQKLIKDSLRALMPGGLLILETPNPENLAVGACNFYLDPTHQRPIPPELLLFATEFAGFGRSKVLRLQESETLVGNDAPTLMSVLTGVSPDYAVIAQKDATPEVLALFDLAFERSYGLSLNDIALRFENHWVKSLADARHTAERLYSHAHLLESRLTDVLTSRSWQITAPFRWGAGQFRRLRDDGFKSRIKAAIKKVLGKLNRWLAHHASLRKHLISFARRLGLLRALRTMQASLYASGGSLSESEENADRTPIVLPPSAQEIFRELESIKASEQVGRKS